MLSEQMAICIHWQSLLKCRNGDNTTDANGNTETDFE